MTSKLCIWFTCLPYQQLRCQVEDMIRYCLARQRGNIAALWPAKIAKINGYPPHPAITLRIAAVLEEISEVQANGCRWVKVFYKPGAARHHGMALFKRENVQLDW